MKKLWLALLPIPALAASPQYTVLDLGPTQQPGGAVYWSMHEPMPCGPLPTLGGGGCNVYAEYLDLAVGDSVLPPSVPPPGVVSPPQTHAAFWSNNAVTDLGAGYLLGEGTMGTSVVHNNSTAYAANDLEEIVGVSDTGFPGYNTGDFAPSRHAVLWTNVRSTNRSMHDLGALAGDFYDSRAFGVNDSHEIVGWTNTIASADGSVLQRAFLYAGGTMYNLSFYLVNAPNIRLTEALSINCQGDIAAIGNDLNRPDANNPRSYLLTRQGTPRTCP